MKKLKFDDSLFGSNTYNLKKADVFDMDTPSILNDHTREHCIDIDFGEYNTDAIDTKAIFIKGDRYTSIFKARLVKNKVPINLDGVTVSANFKEGRNDIVTMLCDEVDIENSIATITLPPYLSDEKGVNLFEVTLTKGEKVIVSQKYSYVINDSLGEGYLGTDTESTALQILIRTVEDMRETLLSDIENTKNDFNSYVNERTTYLDNRIDGFDGQLNTITNDFNQRVEEFTNTFVETTGNIVEEYETTLNSKVDTFNQIIRDIEQDLSVSQEDIDDVINMIGGL